MKAIAIPTRESSVTPASSSHPKKQRILTVKL
jgi:hypothetical protein